MNQLVQGIISGCFEPRKIRTRDGYLLDVFDTGGSGPILVMANAIGVPYDFLQNFSGYLRDRGIRVITWHARGIPGDGDIDAHDVTPLDHANDLIDIVTALNLNDVHLGGYCLGAQIALIASALLQERVKQLFLFNGLFYNPAKTVGFLRVYSVLDMLSRDPGTLPEIHRIIHSSGFEAEGRSEMQAASIIGLEDPELIRILSFPFKQEAKKLLNYAYMASNSIKFDSSSYAKSVSVPCMAVVDTDDDLSPPENIGAIGPALRSLEIITTSGNSHYGLFSDRALFSRIATAVLSQR